MLSYVMQSGTNNVLKSYDGFLLFILTAFHNCFYYIAGLQLCFLLPLFHFFRRSFKINYDAVRGNQTVSIYFKVKGQPVRGN